MTRPDGKTMSESFLEGKDMRIQANQKSLVRGCIRVCLYLAFVSAVHEFGQNVNGTIVGTVTDSTGASVPGASVTITDVNTGVNHSVQTDAGGYYSAPDLPPGSYRVSVQKDGFQTTIHTGIDLYVDNTVRADAKLNPGAVTQTVNVSSAVTPALQTDTADTGRDIDTAPVSQ